MNTEIHSENPNMDMIHSTDNGVKPTTSEEGSEAV